MKRLMAVPPLRPLSRRSAGTTRRQRERKANRLPYLASAACTCSTDYLAICARHGLSPCVVTGRGCHTCASMASATSSHRASRLCTTRASHPLRVQLSDHANIRQRVYKGVIDTPKTVQAERKAALSQSLFEDLAGWKKGAIDVSDGAYVFPSERMTPLAMENVWRRNIGPKLDEAGLPWVNFQVMRRTSSTLLNTLGVEGKLVADQLGHTLDVNQNVYTHSPVAVRREAVNRLEQALA